MTKGAMTEAGKMKEIVLYMHAGSGNHGCEAIVNSIVRMLSSPVSVLSVNAEEDLGYSLKALCDEGSLEIWQERHFKRYRPVHILYYLYRKITGDRESFIRYRYHKAFEKEKPALAISIGGDNYCYDNMVDDLVLMNKTFNSAGIKTILLGCSVEPDLLKNPAIIADMHRYDTIIARESITYEALGKIGHPRLFLLPDPAFSLAKKEMALPEGFAPANTIGLNLSPLATDNEQEAGITMASYKALIQFIIEKTDMQIALIPHVVWKRNDDRLPLRELYEAFQNTGRIIMIHDADCSELKGYIASLRFFIGARTHATIAAYSSFVPTVVVGYSVKARGIAVDLFGTDENYVIPVQTLGEADDLVKAFSWLWEHESEVKAKLHEIIPGYRERAKEIGGIIENARTQNLLTENDYEQSK
ncbi:MAG: polysaccharide pyruvyl transferase family protein [Lachnospiraceae bacterium]|nr:polysaccharide pyruvyl transferase family protein [Lachnospiraceae bacterium]